jgi:MFS family permease
LYFGFSLLGKFLISTISDYIDTFIVFTICALGMTVGAFLFWTMDQSMLKAAVVLTATCWGGIYTLYNLAIVRNFGLKSAGKINGMISSFESAGSFLAPVITGILYEMYDNSYKGALMVITISLLLTTFCSLFFRKNQVN